jgi:hypothetical protein
MIALDMNFMIIIPLLLIPTVLFILLKLIQTAIQAQTIITADHPATLRAVPL